MGQRLKGRNAIVTGGGRGIGRAIALALAEEGANIVVCDLGGGASGAAARDRGPADSVANECRTLGVKAIPNYGDVADFRAAEEIVKACAESFGSVDILCNIAGNFNMNRIPDMTEEEWDSVIGVHLKGTFNLTRHASRVMLAQKYGRIINCSSQEFASLEGLIGNANYAAAKGGIVSLTYATANELAAYGITCNALTPGAATRLAEGIGIKAHKEGFVPASLSAAYRKRGGGGDPTFFGAFVAFLASDAAADINGCLFSCNRSSIGIWNYPRLDKEIIRDWEKQGKWTFDEVERLVPLRLLSDHSSFLSATTLKAQTEKST